MAERSNERRAPWLPDWARPARTTAPPPRTPIQPAPRSITIGDQKLPLVIRKLAHARQMSLRLSPDGREVRISIPRWGRIADAEAFARSRTEWLAGHLAALPQPTTVEPGATVPFRGTPHTIAWSASAARRVRIADGRIELGGPATSLAARLQRHLETEARRLLADDLAYYCARAGEEVPRLSLSRAQRRWGSCSADRSIRLNWRLVMAPDFVRRAVVAHEVAHLAHFDHSPTFHAALARIFDGDLHGANVWLKKQGRGLYSVFG